ncbi:MAG: hypothetical protein ACRCUP_04460 [Mycoplasmatales bacterium]
MLKNKKILNSIKIMFLFLITLSIMPQTVKIYASEITETSEMQEWNKEVGVEYTQGSYVSYKEEIKKVNKNFVSNGDLKLWESNELFERVVVIDFINEALNTDKNYEEIINDLKIDEEKLLNEVQIFDESTTKEDLIEAAEYNPKQARALPAFVIPVLLWLGKQMGAAVVRWITGAVLTYGAYNACRKFNDSNRGMDRFCDAIYMFRDWWWLPRKYLSKA